MKKIIRLLKGLSTFALIMLCAAVLLCNALCLLMMIFSTIWIIPLHICVVVECVIFYAIMQPDEDDENQEEKTAEK